MNNIKVGMTAIEMLPEIIKFNPNIASTQICIYTPRLNMHEGKRPERLVFHSNMDDTRTIRIEDVTVENLNNLANSIMEKEVLGFVSAVWIRTPYPHVAHLPLMDFSCLPVPENIEKIKDFLHSIFIYQGAILFSGRSYHFYGFQLISEGGWLDFLGSCLLSELADPRYIGHRLKDSCGVLRISAGGIRPTIPKIVAIL